MLYLILLAKSNIAMNIAREEVITITASNELEISRETGDNSQFDKIVFFALATPFLLIACFLTLHLIDIFQIQGFLPIIIISFYILFLYLIYKISVLKFNKQKENLKKFREMIKIDYRTCKFCGKQLNIEEFYYTNKNVDLQKMSEFWNNNFYGLLCCTCFKSTPSKFWIKLKAIKKIKNINPTGK